MMALAPETRTKEHQMSDAGVGTHTLGSLGSADGKGVVRIEHRVDSGIDDAWSALTDPARLARWYGEIEGDLRLGGEYRAHLHASGWKGSGRIDACEPPRRLMVTTKQADHADEGSGEVTLAADGDQTTVTWEERGMPLEYLAGYGAGIQVHVEDFAAHLAGKERCDAQVRFAELFPAYQDIAKSLD
jgi:uncharacterized protein YndB with AHSA1/START domain